MSLLITQFSSECKNQIRAIISVSGNFGNVPLEQLLETTRTLFYDNDLKRVFAQSTNLERNCGETPLSIFSSISAILKLASFHLEGEAEREAFRHRNVREQFSRNVLKKFAKIIKQKEITIGVVYSPLDLLKTYLIFEQTELSDSKYSKVNKIQSDVDITKAFPLIH